MAVAGLTGRAGKRGGIVRVLLRPLYRLLLPLSALSVPLPLPLSVSAALPLPGAPARGEPGSRGPTAGRRTGRAGTAAATVIATPRCSIAARCYRPQPAAAARSALMTRTP